MGEETINLIQFKDSSHLTIKGEGVVEGNGYDWWDREWKKQNPITRPHLVNLWRVHHAEVAGILFRNSPKFGIHMSDVDSVYVHDTEIYVDMLKQRDVMQRTEG